MKVPSAITSVIDRLEIELSQDKSNINKTIRPHSDPSKGWIVEINLSNHTEILPLMPTAQRLGYGSISWDLERNAIIITGKIDNIQVGIFINRTSKPNFTKIHRN